MDSWRQKFIDVRDRLQDDEDDDDFALRWVVGLDLGSNSRSKRPRVHNGSRLRKAQNVERDRKDMHKQMMRDYFSNNLVFGPHLFQCRYRMRRELFLSILEKVCLYDSYFVQKFDACGLCGLSPHQKITSVLCMLYYGMCTDATDEYCRTSESTALESLRRFCRAIRAIYEPYHLKQPTKADFEKHFAINERRGFPRMFGSLDCMHWEWKNCPIAWQGDFGDRDGKKSIILEAVATKDLHIWHVFFGLSGSNNDLNVLQRSPLVNNMLHFEACNDTFQINGCEYNHYYLLTDGIYPKWSGFVQSIHLLSYAKSAYFASQQEAVRKDVERCFGVLQARFAIVKNPCM